MGIKIHFTSGDGDFIVEKNKEYYLVSIGSGKVMKANPPGEPTMFFKFSQYEKVANVKWEEENEIVRLLKDYK